MTTLHTPCAAVGGDAAATVAAAVAAWAGAGERSRLEHIVLTGASAEQADACIALAWHLRQTDETRALALAQAALQWQDAHQDRRACRAQLVQAELDWLHARLDAADARTAAAERAARACGDDAAVADAGTLCALIAFDRGAVSTAMAHLERVARQALTAAEASRAHAAQAMHAMWLASGSLDAVEAAWGDRLAAWCGGADPLLAMWAHDVQAHLARRRGHFAAAIQAYDKVYRLGLEIGHRRRAITACSNICTNYLNLRDLDAALAWAEKGLAMARPAGWPASVGSCLTLVGRILTLVGRHTPAREALEEALVVVAPLQGSRTAVITGYYAAELARVRGDTAVGAQGLAKVVADAERSGEKDLTQMACIGLAKAQLTLQLLPQAEATADKALALARQDRSAALQTVALSTLAEIHHALALQAPGGSPATAAAASLPFWLQTVALAATVQDYHVGPGYWDAIARDHAALGQLGPAYAAARQAGAARDRERQGELSRRAMSLAAREQLQRAEAERERQQADAESAEALHAAVRQLHDTLDLLGRVAQAVTAERDIDRVLERLHANLGGLLDAPRLVVWLIDVPAGPPRLHFGIDRGQRLDAAAARLDDDSPEAECLRRGVEVRRAGPPPHGSVLAAPLAMGGQTLGVLAIASPEPAAYGEREQLVFRTLCAHTAVALENWRVVAELQAAQRALQASHEGERIAREQAQEAARLRSAFLAQIATDLRLPLAGLQASVDAVIDEVDAAGTAPQRLSQVLEQSLQVNLLARELLDLARLEAATVELSVEPFSLAELVHDLVHQLSPSAGPGEPVPRISMKGTPALVLGDIGLVERALAALLKCAAGGAAGQGAWVRLNFGADAVLVEVGGPAADAARAPRWPQVGSTPTVGNSLSLAMARQILRLHEQALVEHATAPGAGNCWSFRLPMVEG